MTLKCLGVSKVYILFRAKDKQRSSLEKLGVMQLSTLKNREF